MLNLREIARIGRREDYQKLLSSYGGSLEPLLDDLDTTLNRLLRSDLVAAGDVVRSAACLRKYVAKKHRPRFDCMDARLRHWSGDYRRARQKYRAAVRQYAGLRMSESVARVRKALIEVCMYLGDYGEALLIGKQAVRYYRSKGRDVDVAKVLVNMGNVYHRMDRNRQALQYYDKAHAILRGVGGVALAVVEYNRANIHLNLRDYESARMLYEASATYYREAGMELAESQAEYSLAYLSFLEGKYADALVMFERVYDSFVRLGDARSAATTLLDMVEMDVHLNQFGSAVMLGDQAAEQLGQLGLTYERAKACYFVALAKLRTGDHGQSLRKLREADGMFRREGNELWLGMVENARSLAHLASGAVNRASGAATRAIQLFEKSHDLRRRADAEITRLEVLYRSGRDRDARRLAARLTENGLGNYQRYRIHSVIGDHLYARHDYAEALTQYRAAVKVVETVMSGLYQDEIRFFFAADKYRCYARLVECLLELGRVDDAFVQNLKALEVLNRQPLPEERLRSQVPADLLNRIAELRTLLNQMNRAPRGTTRTISGSVSYNSVEQKLWRLQRKLRTCSYRDRSPSDVSPAAFASSLPVSEGTVVNYVAGKDQIGAFVSTPEGTTWVPLPVTTRHVQVTLRKLHFVLEESVLRPGSGTESPARSYLRQLHEEIWTPLQPWFNGCDVAVVVDGLLQQVPFAALGNPSGGYLKDHHRVSIVVNPADLLRKPNAKLSSGGKRSAVFAVPSDTLMSVEEEGNSICRAFPKAKLYVGASASGATLSEELRRADGFVHIAAHASRSSENPLFSRILMDDGPFFPFDLYDTGVNAQLVTLSGCQTAAPGLYYGNSFSLARAFHQAGSRYVLASLWPVADEATMLFMVEFYARLKERVSVVESYRTAMESVQRAIDHPAYWGSFVLLGK